MPADVETDLVSPPRGAYPRLPNGSSHSLQRRPARGAAVSELKDAPSGTISFLFTDIEGSTALIQELGDEYQTALQSQERMVSEAMLRHSGHIAESRAEEMCAVFTLATDAVEAGLEAQRALHSHLWADRAELRVRMGIHTGEAQIISGIYVGLAVHRAARICRAGHGGQVLISGVTRELVGDSLPNGASLKDLGDHRMKDLGRAEKLYQLLHPDLSANFPALRTLDALPNNLPAQLTSFIGREHEIEEVKRLLNSARLVTLLGPGGAGKTRLALQVAAETLDAYAQGAWLVDLAATAEGSVIPQTIASILGLRGSAPEAVGPIGTDLETPGRGLIDQVLEQLRTGRALVILDNCEHLVEECAELADLIVQSCPQITVLVTSREPLRMAGEARWRVPPLTTPAGREDIERLSEYESTRLFVDRARLNQSDFALTSQNADAVIEICQRLDGMPLAIELAAAWVSVLTPKQILTRLDDQFRLLASGPRRGQSRHQTLRATVDWSYELLTEPERSLLDHLSIFSGGFSLEAAEEVCSTRGVDREEVLHLLSRLVDKSLVLRETEGTTERYRLLETIRQYGWEKVLFAPTPDAKSRSELSADDATLRRDGDYWTIAYSGAEFRLKNSKGLDYLHLLIEAPSREFHVLDAVSKIQKSDATTLDRGDAGEILDSESRAQYKLRLAELEQEAEEARGWNDAERVAKAEQDIEFLKRELAGAVGLGGRGRRAGSASERARMSVSKAIRGAIKKIEEQNPSLGSYLRSTIQTGTYLAYQPDPRHPLRWSFR